MIEAARSCRSCGADIFWLRSDSTVRSAPIDAEPAPNGNIRVDLAAGTYRVLVRERAEAARAAGEQLHLNHFVTCPQAGKW